MTHFMGLTSKHITSSFVQVMVLSLTKAQPSHTRAAEGLVSCNRTVNSVISGANSHKLAHFNQKNGAALADTMQRLILVAPLNLDFSILPPESCVLDIASLGFLL